MRTRFRKPLLYPLSYGGAQRYRVALRARQSLADEDGDDPAGARRPAARTLEPDADAKRPGVERPDPALARAGLRAGAGYRDPAPPRQLLDETGAMRMRSVAFDECRDRERAAALHECRNDHVGSRGPDHQRRERAGVRGLQHVAP